MAERAPRSRTLASRLILWFGGTSMVVVGIAMALTYHFSRSEVVSEVTRASVALAESFATHLTSLLDGVRAVPVMMALDVEDGGLDTEAEISKYLQTVLRVNRHVYGVSLAWKPGAFKPGPRLFAPYWYQKNGLHFVDLASPGYDYSQKDWFRQGITSDRPTWTTPYFDEHGGDTLMVSCVVPFHANGQVVGVATADLSQAAVEDLCRTMTVDNGYAFVVDGQGRLLTWPVVSRVRTTLADMSPTLAARILEAPEGMVEGPDPQTLEPAWVFWRRLPQAGLTFVQVYKVNEVMAEARLLPMIMVISTIVLNLVLILVVTLIARSITRPVQELLRAASMLAEGNLDTAMPHLDTRDEMRALPNALIRMMSDLRDYISRAQDSARREERAARELQIAGDIQKALLPEGFPERPDFDLYAVCHEAHEVGGDFYDFFFIDDERLGFVLADTSGIGIPAALYSGVCRTLLRASAVSAESPAACVEIVNQRLCEDNRTAMFVTAVYGVLETRTGRVALCNAGHPVPLVMRADQTIEEVASLRQRALGVRRDSRYGVQEIVLGAGDAIFLYSDGISEAEAEGQTFFGVQRVREALLRHAAGGARERVEGVVAEARRFSEAPNADDQTALLLRFVRPWRGARRTLRLPNRMEALVQVDEALAEMATAAGISRSVVLDVNLVLEELLTNVIKYAWDDDQPHVITVDIALLEKEIRVRIEDDGRPFDPRKGVPPTPHDDTAIGGWGLRLIAKKVDKMEFRRLSGRNVVTVFKRMVE